MNIGSQIKNVVEAMPEPLKTQELKSEVSKYVGSVIMLQTKDMLLERESYLMHNNTPTRPSPRQLSDCHQSPVSVGGKGTTHYWVCSECKQPCNLYDPKEPSVLDRTAEYILKIGLVQAGGGKIDGIKLTIDDKAAQELAKSEILKHYVPKEELELEHKLHVKGIDDFKKFKDSGDEIERTAAWINQLSPWNLRRGIDHLRQCYIPRQEVEEALKDEPLPIDDRDFDAVVTRNRFRINLRKRLGIG